MAQVGGGAALEIDPPEEDLDLEVAGEHDELDAPQDEPEDEPEISIEDRARSMGWHPLAEFNGDPRKWVPAADFVRKGETEVPIMRDQNRRLQEKVVKLEGRVTSLAGQISSLQNTTTEQLQALKDMREVARRADQRGYDRALKELKDKKLEAVEAGDTVAYRQLEEQEVELTKSRPDPEPEVVAPAAKPGTPPMDPVIAAFAEAHPWWNVDEQLSRAMINAHELVIVRFPGLTLAQQLEKALARVKTDFPERFDDEEEPPEMATETDTPEPAPRAPQRAPTALRPSGAPAPRRNGASPWDQIADPTERADARKQFDRQRKFMPDLTEGEWLGTYLDPHADVLALQASQRRAK